MGRNHAKINFENGGIEELQATLKASSGTREFVRYKALVLIYQGYSHAEVCEILEIAPSTLREWIRKFNERGIDGLLYNQITGRKPKLLSTPLESLIDKYLSVAVDSDERRFTGRLFYGYLTEALRLEVSYSTAIRYLHSKEYTRRYPSKMPYGGDEFERGKFELTLRSLLNDRNNSIWFMDEVGFEANPQRVKCWTDKGRKPGSFYTGDHIRESLLGAVNPQTGEFFSLIMPYVDTGIFQIYLDNFALATKGTHDKGRKVIMILDNASWHKALSLNWHHVTPTFLPAYSPDFNPIERLWAVMKDRYFGKWATRNRDKLTDRIQLAVQSLMREPETIQSVCNTDSFL